MKRTILTINDVGTMINRSVETLRWWRQRGEGPPSYRIGRRVVYDEDAVLAWLDQQRQTARQPGGAA
jgi:DNA-binding transcriptional MerR regulator